MSADKTTGNTRRFPGRARNLDTSPHTGTPAPAGGVSSRERLLVWSCLIAVAAMAWAYLIYLDRQMAARMAHDTMMAQMAMPMERPWAAPDIFFTFTMWVVMMIGMMAGSAAPVISLFAAAQRQHGSHWLPPTVLAFGLGYLVVWIGFSACATLAQWQLHDAAMLSPMMSASSPYVRGAILCAAGAYQLTPLKHACLTQCRSPLSFLMTHWRAGTSGALRMGLQHGAYCLGCCWALMSVLFAVGVMNLAWVAALTLFVFLEKVAPAGAIVARITGVALVAAGILSFTGVL